MPVFFASCTSSAKAFAVMATIGSFPCSPGRLLIAAVAFDHRGLELLDVGLQRGLSGLVLRSLGLVHQDTLLGRLNIRQTKHLLRFLKSIK